MSERSPMSWLKFAVVPALSVALAGPTAFVAAHDAGSAPQARSHSKHAHVDVAAVNVRAAVRAAHQGAPIPRFRPSLKGLNTWRADVGGCNYEHDRIRKLCRRGERSSSRVIVLWGDSHAKHWVTAVETAAIRRGYAAYYFVKPACNATDTVRYQWESFQPCIRFRAWVAKQIKKIDPDILLVAGEMPLQLLGANGNIVSDERTVAKMHSRGLARAVRPLRSSVGKVVFFADVPGLRLPPKECLSKSGIHVGDCTFKRPYRAILEAQAAKRAATRTHEKFLSPTKWFCFHNQCPTIVDHVLTYRDLGHMTPHYSRRLAPSLARALHL